MVELTVKQFEEANLFSNKNLQKIIEQVVNESSNAALVNVFEDKVVLLDHEQAKFYQAKYKFEKKNMSLVFEAFEPIKINKESGNFKQAVKDFFEYDSDDISVVAEAYSEGIARQEKYLAELINESLSIKDFSEIIDFKEIAEANDSIKLDKKNFTAYKERLSSHPINNVKYFNWKDPVVVSVLESNEPVAVVNSSAKEKANELWKRAGFTKIFEEACLEILEDVDAGKAKLLECFKSYPQVYSLDKAGKRTLFGKAIIGSKVLREHLSLLNDGIVAIMEDSQEFINEAEEYKDATDGASDEEKKDAAPELSKEEIEELVSKLKEVSDKVSKNEKLKSYIDKVVEELEGSVEEGTRVDLVKEAISLLTI